MNTAESMMEDRGVISEIHGVPPGLVLVPVMGHQNPPGRPRYAIDGPWTNGAARPDTTNPPGGTPEFRLIRIAGWEGSGRKATRRNGGPGAGGHKRAWPLPGLGLAIAGLGQRLGRLGQWLCASRPQTGGVAAVGKGYSLAELLAAGVPREVLDQAHREYQAKSWVEVWQLPKEKQA